MIADFEILGLGSTKETTVVFANRRSCELQDYGSLVRHFSKSLNHSISNIFIYLIINLRWGNVCNGIGQVQFFFCFF